MPMRSRWWTLWIALLLLTAIAGKAFNRHGHWAAAVILIGLIVVSVGGYVIARHRFRRRMRHWATHSEWTELDPGAHEWPWGRFDPPSPSSTPHSDTTRQPSAHHRDATRRQRVRGENATHGHPALGAVTVRRAWEREVDGLPVTLAEVRWRNDAFDGMLRQRSGSGTVVVVRLPQPQPPMALHFAFEPVGDSPRLDRPALREAYLAGDIPTFTVRGNVLFTVESRDAWLDPDIADQAVARALRVVHLLDLGPDTTRTART